MEMHISNVNSNEKDSKEDKDEMKSRLKKQIEELKSIILQMEWSLDIVNFGKTETAYDLNIPNAPVNEHIYEVPDINIKLQSELYRYSGFYCVKFSKEEYIFNFSPLSRYEKENTFAVQIINKQGKGTLGKWIMPMSIDLDDLISEFSIGEPRNVPHFLRTCKHYIDCYFIRCEQFNALKGSTCHIKNCTLQTNLGYTSISLELTGVYSVENDLYIDITVYLIYAIDEARPQKIEVDSKTEIKLDTNTKKNLKASLKCFKKFDLQTAFDKMLNEKPFTWSKKDDEDSPVETNYLSNSDEEGFLEKFSFVQKEPLKIHKRERKRKMKHRRRKQKNILDLSGKFESNNQTVSQQNKGEPVKNLGQHSMSHRDIDTIKSTRNILKKKHQKLKQTKLRFQVDNDSELHTDNSPITSRVTALEKKMTTAELRKPFTSTPIHRNDQNTSRLIAAASIDNISDIPVNEDNSQDTKTKTNIDVPKQSKFLSKDQFGNTIPAEMRQSRMKKNVKSLIRSKSTTQKKNISRKKVKKT